MNKEIPIQKPFQEDDPLEFVAASCNGNLNEMIENIIEEYIKMGFDQKTILQLFKSPFFKLTHSVYKSKGEEYIKKAIENVKIKWCKNRRSKYGRSL
jgi:hypothetical protein